MGKSWLSDENGAKKKKKNTKKNQKYFSRSAKKKKKFWVGEKWVGRGTANKQFFYVRPQSHIP